MFCFFKISLFAKWRLRKHEKARVMKNLRTIKPNRKMPYYGFPSAGRVKRLTPKVEKSISKPKKKGRAKYKSKFNKLQNGQLKNNSELNKTEGVRLFLVFISPFYFSFFLFSSIIFSNQFA